MENVFITISHGFQVRNFIQTRFIDELTSAYRVIFVVNQLDKSFVEKYLKRLAIKNTEVAGVVIVDKKYEDTFLLLRKNIFVSPKRAQTKNILNEMNSSTLGKWQKPLTFLNRIFGTFESSRSLWRGVEGLFLSGSEFDELFKKYKPIKVITGDYGTKPFEIRLLRAARRHGVPSIAVVPSWDNLTSKGVMGVKPDYLAVWNDIMRQEALELHAFNPDKISITGPMQFDNFFDPSYKMPEEEFRKKFGVAEGQPVIVFGTITPKYFKYNLEVLKILKGFVEQGTIEGNPKIIIRVHPQVVSDPILGDNLDEYKRLAADGAIFSLSLPEVQEWGTMQVPLETDYRELISILSYSRIAIASASTIIFDSFACNTKFIGIGFDGLQPQLPKHRSVRRMFEFEHYKNVYAIGGFRIAESQKELAQYINEYLDNPEIHKEKQLETLKQQVKFLDGQNYQRVMKAVREI
ncbi:MAG: hypothetical protein WKF87_15285 [Chryseolinea sp.]